MIEIVDYTHMPSLISEYIAQLRSVEIQGDRMRFRRNIERLGEIMAYEISRRLSYETGTVRTPLGEAEVHRLSDRVVLATILRAGLPFHHGFLNYFDEAGNAFVSAYRKYKDALHFDIHIEYIASPDITGSTLVITDPMLATGGSMEMAFKALLTKGMPRRLHIASIIASKTALTYLEQTLPKELETTIWLAALDDGLNEHSYIVPGLGDAGDLAYGQKL